MNAPGTFPQSCKTKISAVVNSLQRHVFWVGAFSEYGFLTQVQQCQPLMTARNMRKGVLTNAKLLNNTSKSQCVYICIYRHLQKYIAVPKYLHCTVCKYISDCRGSQIHSMGLLPTTDVTARCGKLDSAQWSIYEQTKLRIVAEKHATTC